MSHRCAWDQRLDAAIDRLETSPTELDAFYDELLDLARATPDEHHRAVLQRLSDGLVGQAAGMTDYVIGLLTWMEGVAGGARDGDLVATPIPSTYRAKVIKAAKARVRGAALVEAHRYDRTVQSEMLLRIGTKLQLETAPEQPLRRTARVARNAYFAWLHESSLRELSFEKIADWWSVLTWEWNDWQAAPRNDGVPGLDVPIDSANAPLRIDPAARLAFLEWRVLSGQHEAGINGPTVSNDIDSLRPVTMGAARRTTGSP